MEEINLLEILATIAQNEREIARRRQAAGIAAARERGVKFGRPVKKTPKKFGELVEDWENKKLTFKQVLKKTRLTESTFYRRAREYRRTRDGN